ncbi:MAG: M14 family zinc carboxypeptidase, partial [Planctomycetota bacterium]
IHAYSELLLWPWGYTSTPCADQSSFSKVGTAMHDAILASAGHDYLAGPVYTTIYPASGGVNDWAYGALGQLSYCVEVRDTGTYGFVMPASEILPNARENFEGAMAMMEETLKACTITLAAGPDVTMPADTATPVRVSVTANVGSLLASNPVRLKWQVNDGAVQTANMALASGQWGASLPATACGSTLKWWVEAETNFSVSRWPSNSATSGRSTSTGTCAIEGDLDGDGVVGGGDLSVLLLDYGPCAGCPSDLDQSGTVDFGDVAYLLLLFS